MAIPGSSATHSPDTYIAGDWGTSNLTLALVESCSGNILQESHGPGISTIERDAIPELLNKLTKNWALPDHHEIWLCGMAGANIGWREAGYLDCPVGLTELATQLCKFETDNTSVVIVPGIRCQNPTGAPDVMRGEETQILGAITMMPELAKGDYLLCLPGTHNKWSWLHNGNVHGFITSISGELFALLQEHSILLPQTQAHEIDTPCFMQGVQRNLACQQQDLLHILFEVRSRQLSGEYTPDQAAAFASGLIIGRDVSVACNLNEDKMPLLIIGSSRLNKLYQQAATALGFDASTLPGKQLALAGIHSIRNTYLKKACANV